MNEETIFATARQWSDGPVRRAFLDQVCAGQPQLRAQVESLLKADAEAGSRLEHPAGFNPQGYDVATNIAGEKSPRNGASPEGNLYPFLLPSNKPGCIGKLSVYDVYEVIGRGGMGIVLRGLDPKLNRIVAIKVLSPEFAANAMARKRFLREAQAAAAVSHDHVVTIHAVDDDDAVPFLVMECIVGQSLQQKIDRVGALPLTEILRIGMQIAMGLTAAHKQGLIHRDIKPANILLENGVERVKITDFGLARATDDVGITQSGVIAGTPQYMSPEQAMGDPIDQRSDLFSLGSVLYTMCTGRPAFRADSTIAVIRRVCDDAPRPIAELNPDIPGWLVAIIHKLLAKKPAERFQTAAEVASLLEQHLAIIQQSTAASGHRAALRRHTALHRATADTNTSDRIWSYVGIVTLCMAVIGWGFRFVTLQADPETTQIAVPQGSSIEIVELGTNRRSGIPGNLKAEAADPRNPDLIPIPSPSENSNQLASMVINPVTPNQAALQQAAWAKSLGVPVEYTNSLGMKFRLIPPGEFLMGCTPEEMQRLDQELELGGAADFEKFAVKSSQPQHRVRLTEPYYLGQYEVTVAQFRKFAESPKGQFDAPPGSRFTWKQFVDEGRVEHQPVLGVSWEEARLMCSWLTEQDQERVTYDLPTEAEWEYACRAGSQKHWSFGDDPALLESHGIVGQRGTSPPTSIGLKNANPFGIFDMHGNVDEWCLDWHDRGFYARSPLNNPVYQEQPSDPGSGRVARGGAWNAPAWWSHSGVRTYDFPLTPVHPKGFRVAIRGNIKALSTPM